MIYKFNKKLKYNILSINIKIIKFKINIKIQKFGKNIIIKKNILIWQINVIYIN